MGYAERIYERVKLLPDSVAEEVLDFAEFVAMRRIEESASAERPEVEFARRRAELERVFAKYRIDLSGFKFDREEANARR